MKLSIFAVLAAVAAVPAAMPAGAQTQNPSFNLLNRAASPIKELYVTPAGDANWGRNRLVSGPIAAGAGFAVRRRVDGNCIFDIRVVFADGRREDRRALNTCTADDVAVGGAASPIPVARMTKLGDDPSFRLVNRSAQPIAALYATPAGLGNWGANRLDAGDVAPQTDHMVSIPKQAGGACQFDVKVVFADRKALEKHNTNLCRITDLPVP